MADALVESDTAPVDSVLPRAAQRRAGAARRERREVARKEGRRDAGTSSRRRVERRYRQTVRRIDLWSVVKIAVCFYLCALVVILAAGMFLWWIATAFGAVDNLEEFVGTLIGSNDFQLLSWRILRGSTLIGLVVVCLMVVVTTLGAAFYNLFAEILGGVEITVVEED